MAQDLRELSQLALGQTLKHGCRQLRERLFENGVDEDGESPFAQLVVERLVANSLAGERVKGTQDVREPSRRACPQRRDAGYKKRGRGDFTAPSKKATPASHLLHFGIAENLL
jgi:hypothetical protein